MRKGLKVIIFIILFIVLINIGLKLISHHEVIESSNVDKITFICHDGEMDAPIIYSEKKDINRILKKLQRVNFYKNYDFDGLQESPLGNFKIYYKDGTIGYFDFAGVLIMISNNDNRGLYWYNPKAIEKVFDLNLNGNY